MKGYRRRIGESTSGPTTYIAKGCRIKGTLTGQGAYAFCGEMEGDCDIDGPVTLADGGQWTGTLKATDVVIAGRVDGDVIAKNRVEIAGSARIAGSLSGASIAVAEGAVIEGEIRITSGESPTTFTEKRSTAIDQTSSAA